MSSIPQFTSHNMKLKDGTRTFPSETELLKNSQRFRSIIRSIKLKFGDLKGLKIVDLGCLEGGYTIEFARLGMEATGIEIREENLKKARFLKRNLGVKNVTFHHDDVLNIDKYGKFDVIFCAGILYHLDKPRNLIEKMAECTDDMLILHTHYSREYDDRYDRTIYRKKRVKGSKKKVSAHKMPERLRVKHNYNLSKLTENEGVSGRWFKEFRKNINKEKLEHAYWASYTNDRSFWILKSDLLELVRGSGFDLIYEQYDFLEDISKDDYIHKYDRGMFVCIKE